MDSDQNPARSPEPRRPDADLLAKLRAGSPAVSALGASGKYMGLGLQFGGAILLFLWIGQWVDRKLGTNGVFVLVGVFVGAGAAFYSMYRSLMADQRREEAEAARQRAEDAKRGGR
jgi:F0F1-type ATP synthase assembly protein I